MKRFVLHALLAAMLVFVGDTTVRAGSTEPELALAEANASVESGVVSVELLGNFDYGNFTRLGYPLVLLVTQGTTVGRLGFDGTVLLGTGGSAPVPLAGAAGVVTLARNRVTAVLPPAFGVSGSATLRLEATFDGATLMSNAVPVQW